MVDGAWLLTVGTVDADSPVGRSRVLGPTGVSSIWSKVDKIASVHLTLAPMQGKVSFEYAASTNVAREETTISRSAACRSWVLFLGYYELFAHIFSAEHVLAISLYLLPYHKRDRRR